MDNLPLSEIISEFTLDLSLEKIPMDVQEFTRLLILDSLGVAIASYQLDHINMLKKVVYQAINTDNSTIWGTQDKVSLADAVLVNASLIHGLDYDDTHVRAVVHPSASVLSTAFTVGEAVKASGQEILSAIICGYEIIIRLGLAANGRFHDRGFHATAILSPFAAVCVAAKLMKVSKEVLMNALGICGSQAAGIQEFLHDGSWVKKIHPGWAAHAAIYALNLAKNGFKGPIKVFEGTLGLFSSHIATAEGVKDPFLDLNYNWLTKEVAIKLYPCCHMAHSFIDCTLELQAKHKFKLEEIKKIECRSEERFAHVICNPIEVKRNPTTESAMRFSLPYLIAIALLKGKAGPEEFNPKHMAEARVRELINKVECVVDESTSNPGHFPGWVKITLQNGEEYTLTQLYEKGSEENPITSKDILDKFKNNAGIYLADENIKLLIKKVSMLENITNIEEILQEMLAQ